MLVNLFERVQFFLKRLGVHTCRITPTKEMAEILVKIMVEVLSILAIATKEVQQSRTSTYYIRTSTNRPIPCLNRNIFEETGRKGGYRRCLQEAG